ncbi:hypothetical protein PV327_004268 [Microctonus hyperodae]|uniref:Methyltransferase-like protein 17, mitochondrial n=1 Tax=Microctonus hyperodae TaxID=165561 RepID=A0AA39FC72_MICHY|nr:hypothetical protein PV327_004268 [Microctonus hyperodae]
MFYNNNFQMFKQIHRPLIFQLQKCSTKVQRKLKPCMTLDENIDKLIKADELKPRKQEGVIHRATLELPKWIIRAMKSKLEDYPKSDIIKNGIHLHRYLNSMMPPPEKYNTESQYIEVQESIMKQRKYQNMTEFDNIDILPELHDKTIKVLKKKISPWAPIQYDKYRGLSYMLGRGAQDYAILYKIMKEIKTRDKKFRPKTLLDFGSGIGTVSWVTNEFWHHSLKERMCIDISKEMNDLAEAIINLADPKFKNTGFYREYLPITSVPKFDIVVSSMSLLELPNRKTRLDIISSLWRKTEKYLVLVEYGTKGGFQIISEARDFIHQMINIQQSRNSNNRGFVFSPCPHDADCPMKMNEDHKCAFETKFFQISFNNTLIPRTESYTYVVFKKDADREEKDYWPRIVRPVIVRSRHSICRVCTSAGKLQELHFTKAKHDRSLYYCARNSRWGDRLPIKIDENEEK